MQTILNIKLRSVYPPFVAGLILILASGFSLYGSKGLILFVAFFNIIFLIAFRSTVLSALREHKILFFILVFTLMIGTCNSFFINNMSFSFYQLARSQVWALIGPVVAFGILKRHNISSQYKCTALKTIEWYVYLLSVLFFSDCIFGLNISPAYFSVVDELSGIRRNYLFGYELVIPFLPVFIKQKKYLCGVLMIMILLATGGKLALFLLLFSFGYIILNSSKINTIKSLLCILVALLLGTYSYYILDRLTILFMNGDGARWSQFLDVTSIISKDPINFFFGIGFGTPFSDGYFNSNLNADFLTSHPDLVENSKFDVENGYLFLLLRFGLIGAVVYFLLLSIYFKKDLLYFGGALLISFFSISFVGPSGSLFFIFFALASILSPSEKIIIKTLKKN